MVAVVGISTSSQARPSQHLATPGTNLLAMTPGRTLAGADAVLPPQTVRQVRHHPGTGTRHLTDARRRRGPRRGHGPCDRRLQLRRRRHHGARGGSDDHAADESGQVLHPEHARGEHHPSPARRHPQTSPKRGDGRADDPPRPPRRTTARASRPGAVRRRPPGPDRAVRQRFPRLPAVVADLRDGTTNAADFTAALRRHEVIDAIEQSTLTGDRIAPAPGGGDRVSASEFVATCWTRAGDHGSRAGSATTPWACTCGTSQRCSPSPASSSSAPTWPSPNRGAGNGGPPDPTTWQRRHSSSSPSSL